MDSFSYKVIKRGVDIILSLLGLVVLSPLMALIALIIKIDSPGKIFYLQKRCCGKTAYFWIYKFRTMPEGREKKTGPAWPDENDTQCTRLGRFLRCSHLDELPQLLNILQGSMSLVGPRPERPYFVKKFRKVIAEYEFRHRIKPGLTGWAQINGYRGSDTSIRERVKCDLFYIKNWSLLLDFQIIFQTLLPKNFFLSLGFVPKRFLPQE